MLTKGLLGLFIFMSSAFADLPYRITSPDELHFSYDQNTVVRDGMGRVKGCRVVHTNRFLLEKDFPFTKKFDDQTLDAWILHEFAFLSRTQSGLDRIRHTPIPWDDLSKEENRKIGYRPEGYRRAGIAGANSEWTKSLTDKPLPLVDLKGIGHSRNYWAGHIELQIDKFKSAEAFASYGNSKELDMLRTKGHSDGLMSLGEAIAELERQEAAQRLFDEWNQRSENKDKNLQTVEGYFIIQCEVYILKENGRAEVMAIYGRQAHYGRSSGYKVPATIYRDDHGGKQCDAFHSAAVDFGGILVTDIRLIGVLGLQHGWKGRADPQATESWARGHDLAHYLTTEEGKKDRFAIQRHVDARLSPVPFFPDRYAGVPQSFDEFLVRYLETAPDVYGKARFLKNRTGASFLNAAEVFLKRKPVDTETSVLVGILSTKDISTRKKSLELYGKNSQEFYIQALWLTKVFPRLYLEAPETRGLIDQLVQEFITNHLSLMAKRLGVKDEKLTEILTVPGQASEIDGLRKSDGRFYLDPIYKESVAWLIRFQEGVDTVAAYAPPAITFIGVEKTRFSKKIYNPAACVSAFVRKI